MYEVQGASFQLVGIFLGVPVIIDMNGRRTVTNAAESVVAKVLELVRPRGAIQAIVYRDAYGEFDALVVDTAGRFVGYAIMRASSQDEALEKLPEALRQHETL
jgi:hypothetical protein